MDESRGLGENPNVELAEVASWDILSTTRVSTWEQQQGCWTCIRVALAANIGCVSSCTPAPLHASLHLQSVYRICANSVKCMLHRLYLYFDLKQPLTHSEPTCVFIKFSRGRGGLDFHCLIASPSLTDILGLSVFFIFQLFGCPKFNLLFRLSACFLFDTMCGALLALCTSSAVLLPITSSSNWDPVALGSSPMHISCFLFLCWFASVLHLFVCLLPSCICLFVGLLVFCICLLFL